MVIVAVVGRVGGHSFELILVSSDSGVSDPSTNEYNKKKMKRDDQTDKGQGVG